MGSIYRKGEGKAVLTEQGVNGLLINKNKEIELIKINIECNCFIANHTVEFPSTFYILSGTGAVAVDGDEVKVHKGDVVEIAAGEERGWINRGDIILEILVMKHI